MISNIMLFALLGNGGDFRSKLLKLADSAGVNPQGQEFTNACQSTVDKIKEVQASSGPITKDTLRAYWDVQLKPDQVALTVGRCAALNTTDGSDLRTKQEESLKVLYSFFLDLHMVVDTHGQPSFFDPSYMQLFDATIPLVSTHQACNPELMTMIEPTINDSWLMKGLSSINTEIAEKTPLSDFEAQIQSDRTKYYNIAKQKTDVCINGKLKDVRPYGERAPASVRKEWESTVRKAFTDNSDISIVKIVFTTPEFKRIAETKAEITHSGDLNINNQDYDAMDVMVYARNGDYVDGFIVTLYKDRIQNTAYARFYGFDAHGNLKPAHRVLPENAK